MSEYKSETTLTDGRPIYPEHRELKSNGQQKDYIVLSENERAKGFIRPVRRSYMHLKCGATTTMDKNHSRNIRTETDVL